MNKFIVPVAIGFVGLGIAMFFLGWLMTFLKIGFYVGIGYLGYKYIPKLWKSLKSSMQKQKEVPQFTQKREVKEDEVQFMFSDGKQREM